MSKSIFISHVFEDAQYIGNIKEWVKDPDFGFSELVVETQHDFRKEGVEVVRNLLKKSILRCQALIVFIGKDTHNKEWIRIEAEIARSIPIQLICVRLPNETGAKPKILANVEETPLLKKKVRKALLSI